jgi:hypothetical protein
MKKFFTLLLAAFVTMNAFSQTAAVPSGDGTLATPYQIASLANLYWLAEQVNAGTDYTGKYFRQEVPIDATVTSTWFPNGSGGYFGWTPIGSVTKFSGHYDGDGYTITGLYINRPGTGNVGLFGYIGHTTNDTDATTIKNLGVINATVNGARGTGALVGRVVGNANTLIKDCYATGGTVTGDAATGGLVGANNSFQETPGGTNNPVIYKCYSTNNVIFSNNGTDNQKIGGLVGCNQKGNSIDSYARGSVTVNSSGKAVERVGGFAGCTDLRGNIIRCYSTGQVTVNAPVTKFGGLVGNLQTSGNGNNGVVTDSYWDTQTSLQASSAGGLGRTTAQMITQGNYATWNFTDIWAIASGANDGYPTLRPEIINHPVIITQSVTQIMSTAATFNANMVEMGNQAITQHGHCYATATLPTISNSKTELGVRTTTGFYTSNITGLSTGTIYYVRAYATTALGTTYGEEVTFTTADKSWTGAISSIWSEAGNWSPSGVPAIGQNVSIAAAVTVDADLASPAVCNNLSINTGGSVTIAAGKALTVNGTLLNFSGNAGLLIKSNATGTGSLLNTTVGVNATVERYLTKYNAVPDHMFHLLSSPVTAQAIRPEFVTNAPTEGHDFYAFDEVSNMWINTKAGVATWNPSFESNFIVGKGYLVSYPQDETKVFAGNLNAADVTLNLTYTVDMGNGWNLLGNPYPSAIDWNAINPSGLGDGVDAALYYYDHNEEKYRYYIALAGVDNAIGDGQRYIPAMQGFMVHAKSSGTRTVNITNASRTHLGQTIFYKSATATQGSFSITAGNVEYSDKAFIHFHSGATEEFDGEFDAYKLRSYNALSPELYTRGSDNSELAINGLPGFSETVSIPVSFEYKSTGEHTFSADLSGITGMVVYLNDQKENTSTNLTQNPVYTFNVSEGDPINRFSLTAGSLGMDEPGAQSSTLVYSNANTIFVVGAAANSQITVYSVSGNILTRMYTQDKGIEAIDATTFPKGVYVVAVQGETSRISRKVVL